jgi:hypothetical protein
VVRSARISSKSGWLWTGVLVLAVVGGCKKKGAGVAGVTGSSASAMSLLPKEANIVFSVDATHVRGTKVWDAILSSLKSDPDAKAALDKSTQECGFDPTTDLNSLTVGLSGVAKDQFAVVISGNNLSEAKISDCIKKDPSNQDMTTTTYNGKTFYENSDMVVFFPDANDMAIAGGEAWAKKMVDLAGGTGDAIDKNSDLMALVSQAAKDKAMWGAGILPQAVKDQLSEAAGGGDGGAALSKVSGVYGSVDLTSGLAAEIDAACATAADANTLLNMANDFLDQAKPLLSMMQLDSLGQDIKLSVDGSTLKMALNMPQADLDKVVSTVQDQAGAP